MIRPTILATALTVSLWACAGCNGSGETAPAGAPRRLVAMPRSPIPDLPVPLNFSLGERSVNTESPGGLRFVDHVYKGSDDVISVRQFYVDQMPTFSWQPASHHYSQGTVTLNYAKGTENCVITIEDGNWWHSTLIRARIYPSGLPARSGGRPAGEPDQK